MRVLVAALLLVMMLPACTRTVWQKPGATPEVAQRDSRDCDRQAYEQARAAWAPGHITQVNRGVPPSLRQSEHRQRYAQCMRARGYAEVEAPK
jgi:hypothetical protein